MLGLAESLDRRSVGSWRVGVRWEDDLEPTKRLNNCPAGVSYEEMIDLEMLLQITHPVPVFLAYQYLIFGQVLELTHGSGDISLVTNWP